MSEAPAAPRLRPILFYPWLLLLIGPVIEIARGRLRPTLVAGGLLLLFVVTFMVVIQLALPVRKGQRQVRPAAARALILLAVLTAALIIVGGHDMFKAFYLLAMACGIVCTVGSERLGPIVVAVVATGAAVTAWLIGAGDEFSIWYTTLLSGLVVGGFLRLIAAVDELREARNVLARAAVAEERLRFARDLHDLLGHTLSVIVVKAEAVRRLQHRDPELAQRQAVDIESIGRQALSEIRDAVTGYRRTSLRDELDGARAALEDAGLEVTVQHYGPPLPPEAETLLGWAVREGSTNVLRHSGARRCDIRVRAGDGVILLEIIDDGKGCAASVKGNGLRGLSERLELADGVVELSPVATGGSRLLVSLPAVIEVPEPR